MVMFLILSLPLISAEEYGFNFLDRLKTFLNLEDTPASYSGGSGDCVVVNSGATGLEFVACSTASGGNFSAGEFQGAFNTNISDIQIGNFSFTDFQASYDSNLTNIFDQDLNTTSNANFSTLNLSGNLIVNGGDIGLIADTDLVQLLVNEFDVNGDILATGTIFADLFQGDWQSDGGIFMTGPVEGELRFNATQGTDLTDLTFDLDGVRPRIFSITDNTIEITDTLIITGDLISQGNVVDFSQSSLILGEASNASLNPGDLNINGNLSVGSFSIFSKSVHIKSVPGFFPFLDLQVEGNTSIGGVLIAGDSSPSQRNYHTFGTRASDKMVSPGKQDVFISDNLEVDGDIFAGTMITLFNGGIGEFLGGISASPIRGSTNGGTTLFFQLSNYTFEDGNVTIRENLTVGNDLFVNNRVGIGTSTPTHELNVLGKVNFSRTGQMDFILENPTRPWILTSDDSPDVFNIGTASSRALLNILPGGNVGIGTSTPDELLDVHLDQNAVTRIRLANQDGGPSALTAFRMTTADTDFQLLSYGPANTGTRYGLARANFSDLLANTGLGLFIGTGSDDEPIIFGNNALERMRIDAGGNVGIGTASPASTLHVVGTLNVTSNVRFPGLTTDGTETANVCMISATGELLEEVDDVCTLSGRRFKENIIPIEYGIDEVMRLNPVSFKYKEEHKILDQNTKIGFIAEDMALVIPEVVSYNEDGSTDSVDYKLLTSLLTSAMQDLFNWNTDQDAEIKAIKDCTANSKSWEEYQVCVAGI